MFHICKCFTSLSQRCRLRLNSLLSFRLDALNCRGCIGFGLCELFYLGLSFLLGSRSCVGLDLKLFPHFTQCLGEGFCCILSLNSGLCLGLGICFCEGFGFGQGVYLLLHSCHGDEM